MLSKNQKKYFVSLQQRKYRQKYDKFIAQGPKICLEILESNKTEIVHILATQEFITSYINRLIKHKSKIIEVDRKELIAISTVKTPNQVVFVCIPTKINRDLPKLRDQWSLYLDKVQEPGNMGAILRIADWFGIKNVLLGPGCADLYNPKVIQASMGSFLRLNITKIQTVQFLQLAAQIPAYAAKLGGSNIYKTKVEEGIIVLGNESRGIQESVLDASKYHIEIPKKGRAESLNVAVACGIICSYLTTAS